MNLSFLKNVFIALIIGLLATIFFAQQDAWIKEQVGLKLQKIIEQQYQCTFAGTVRSLNFFTGTIELDNISVQPSSTQQWHWQCTKVHAQISLQSLILYGLVDCSLVLDHLNVYTAYDGEKLAIADHVRTLLFDSSSIPTLLQSILIRKSSLTIEDICTNSSCTLTWTSQTNSIDNMLNSTIHIHDGSVSTKGQTVLNAAKGTADVGIEYSLEGPRINAHIDAQCTAPLLPKDPLCFLQGEWKNNTGSLTFENITKTFAIAPLTISQTQKENVLTLHAHFPLFTLNYLLPSIAVGGIEGIGDINIKKNLDNGVTSGNIVCTNLAMESLLYPIKSLVIDFLADKHIYNSSLHVQLPWCALQGACSYDAQTRRGSVDLRPETHIPISGTLWSLDANTTHINISGIFAHDKPYTFTSNYCVSGIRENEVVQLSGSLSFDSQIAHAQGLINDTSYEVLYQHAHNEHIKKIVAHNAAGQPAIELYADADDYKQLKGRISVTYLKNFMQKYGYSLHGNGFINVASSAEHNYSQWCVDLDEQSSLRLPAFYNCIQKLHAVASFNWTKKILQIDNCAIDLTTGTVRSPHAKIIFNETWKPLFIHAPVTFNNCLINWEKKFFAQASGNLLLSQQNKQGPHMSGTILLDHAQLGQNIFNTATDNAIQSPSDMPISCNIALSTRKPMHITTAALDATAHVEAHVQNNVGRPIVAGSVLILNGHILFPYKNLQVTKGLMYLLPGQEPTVELLAHDIIKKYDVTMHVSGPLSKQSIILESSPALTQEQIFSLLVIGNEQEPLNALAPALVMNNMQDFIFGPKPYAWVENKLQKIINPLRNIHVVPSFSNDDQQSLQASVEMDIGDKWRAMIQKKIQNSHEDLYGELEYIVSDEMSVKGVRDQQGDVRAEVEVKWKWG